MFPNDPYIVKATEYLLGIGFLLLFVPFWRYATGGVTAAADGGRGGGWCPPQPEGATRAAGCAADGRVSGSHREPVPTRAATAGSGGVGSMRW